MSKKPEEPFLPKEDAEPKIDFNVLDEAVKKVLAAPPQPKRKPSPKP